MFSSSRTLLPTIVLIGMLFSSTAAAVQSDWALESMPIDRSAEQLSVATLGHLDAARVLRDEILAVEGPRTPENTLLLLNELYMHIDAASSENGLFEEVHPDADMRAVAEEGSRSVSAFITELSLDRALYEALEGIELEGEDAATQFAVKKELRDYRRAGVDQPPEVQGRIAALNSEIVELGQEFSRNIKDDVRVMKLTDVSQLEGLPDDYIAAHPVQDDGAIHVSTTYPDYIPFMRYSTQPELRRQLYLEYNNRGYPRNVVVLESLIAKRDEKAKLLGYENWADYVTEDKMVGSEANAAAFIEQIAGVSREAAERDYQMLLDTKRQDVPDATGVADWEKGYYSEKVRAEQYDFDSQAARPYFDYERVRQGIFDVTSRLFGVRYEQVAGLDLWDEDVTAWDLFDGDEQIGRFFLDMHPRDNKYGHAAQFGYRSGVEGERLPVATLVCNFPNPKDSDDGVALMEFGQVSTFFHEFGHLLHTMFAGHRRWAMNSGISTEWDFVEAPSQMLEEWLYDAETLQSFAMHYETGEPIPEALIDKIRAAAEFGKGMNTAHQAFYAALSFNCYARDVEGLDTTELVQELQAKYSPFAYVDGSHFQCNFGHLNGYSAIYYTYKWSEVIAKDMFSRFAEDGVLNEETARLYREKVLEPGGSKPAAELVEDFLGREYGFESFRQWLDGSEADA
ncbi:MAG: Zn-dependent oligopeptidase [Planctomycetota bacterium]|jgi:thimet oligopeptidase|nr:Zn-dependent oligopeptidase [Planctomycetota bacterium]